LFYGQITHREIRKPYPLYPLPLIKRKGKALKRGADAPLKTPHIINPAQGESKRGEASLTYNSPSLGKGGGKRRRVTKS